MKKLRKALADLNELYPRPGLPLLELSEPFDTNNPWNHGSWPNNGLPGVYIFADTNDKVLYIGKASASTTISIRLGAYWRIGGKGETESKHRKSENIRYVYTIGILNDRAFEAPSIEEYLIREVRPERNFVGK